MSVFPSGEKAASPPVGPNASAIFQSSLPLSVSIASSVAPPGPHIANVRLSGAKATAVPVAVSCDWPGERSQRIASPLCILTAINWPSGEKIGAIMSHSGLGKNVCVALLQIPEPRAFSWLASREYLAVRSERERIDRGLAQRKCRLALTGRNVPKMHAAGEPTRCESFTVGGEGEAKRSTARHVDFASRLFVLVKSQIQTRWTIRRRTWSKTNPAAPKC